jgi:hypothetical protein
MNEDEWTEIEIERQKLAELNECPCCGANLVMGCCIDCGEVYI